MLQILGLFLFPLVLIGGFFIAVSYFKKKDEKRMLDAATNLLGAECVQLKYHGTKKPEILSIKFLQIQVPEGTFYIKDHTGSEETPSSTLIALPIKSPCEFKISPEGALSGLGKKIGLVKEVEIGRRDLDDAFLIQMKEQGISRSLIVQTQFQNALELLKNVPSLKEACGLSDSSPQISLFKIGPALTIKLSDPLDRLTKDQMGHSLRALKLFSEAIERCK